MCMLTAGNMHLFDCMHESLLSALSSEFYRFFSLNFSILHAIEYGWGAHVQNAHHAVCMYSLLACAQVRTVLPAPSGYLKLFNVHLHLSQQQKGVPEGKMGNDVVEKQQKLWEIRHLRCLSMSFRDIRRRRMRVACRGQSTKNGRNDPE